MINLIIAIGVISVGIFFLAKAISGIRKSKILLNGKILTGKKARFYSIIFVVIACAAIILPLIIVIFSK